MLLANRSDASEVFENSHITEPLLEFDWVQLIRSSAKTCVAPKVIAVARTILEKAFIHPPKGKDLGVENNPNPLLLISSNHPGR
jgi:hypothetical protein